MPDRCKEKIRSQVGRFYAAITPHVDDGEFWNTAPEKDTLITAWEARAITLPSIPIGDMYLDFYETFDENGDVCKYKYKVLNASNKQVFRYETRDDEDDTDHVHRYSVPGDSNTAKKRPHTQPSIQELVEEITQYNT